MNNLRRKKLIVTSLIGVAIFVLGLVIGRYLARPANNLIPIRSPESGNFKFIKPLIGFDTVSKDGFTEFNGLKSDLEKYIANNKASGQAKDVGIYFRRLDDGHYFGINENMEFEPGSLLKVPIMIAYFKKTETDPDVLTKRIVYEPQNLLPSPLNKSSSTLVPDRAYTVEELLQIMITESDNGAKDMLVKNIGINYLEEVFYEIGFLSLDEASVITPRVYSFFFRRLHNSTYLSREFSEKTLRILSETNYTNGLAAGIPSNILISHKFGERGDYAEGILTGTELHDCGIVYYKSRYLLCVMTRGYDTPTLQGILKDISKTIFNYVKNNS